MSILQKRFHLMESELSRIEESEISLLDLIVYDEIMCQLEKEITDNELETLFSSVINAYLKSEYSDLGAITRYCINHITELNDLSTWSILENC